MPRIESSRRRYANKQSQRYKAWLIQKNRKKKQAQHGKAWFDSDLWIDGREWID